MRPIRGEVAGLVVAAAAHARSAADRPPRRRPARSCVRPDLADLAAGSGSDRSTRAPGSSPSASTCTLCPSSGRAIAVPFCDDGAERAVARDLPADLDVRHRHAAAVERLRREPRPQHDAVRPRIAGRDAERERIAAEERLREHAARRGGRHERGRAQLPRDVQQLAARQSAAARDRRNGSCRSWWRPAGDGRTAVVGVSRRRRAAFYRSRASRRSLWRALVRD